MGEPTTRSQQAAAWHGLATNRALGPGERLGAALKALDEYETELASHRRAIEALRDTGATREWILAEWNAGRWVDQGFRGAAEYLEHLAARDAG
jgi:hypothetical protein